MDGGLEIQMTYLKSVAVGLAGALLSIVIVVAGASARVFWLVRRYPPPEGADWGVDFVMAFKSVPYHSLIVVLCFGVGFLWEFRRVSS